jgi:hypothetical protein
MSEEKTKIGWKVTYKGHSVVASNSCLDYELNKATVPQPGCGPLAVFVTEGSARYFMSLWPDTDLYRCRYIPTKGRRALWSRAGSIRSHDLPPGTDFADSVTLLEKVPVELYVKKKVKTK